MMNFVPPPIEALPHEFVYREFTGLNDYGEDGYADDKTIEHCKVDMTPVFARSSTANESRADGVVFCFNHATTPFLPFKKRSKIKLPFEDEERTIEKVIINFHPYSDEVYSYELEVL